jgi:hypothetical protein
VWRCINPVPSSPGWCPLCQGSHRAAIHVYRFLHSTSLSVHTLMGNKLLPNNFYCLCLPNLYLLVGILAGRCCSPLVLVLKVSRPQVHSDGQSDSDAEPVALVSLPLEAPACRPEVPAPSPSPTLVTRAAGVLRDPFSVVHPGPPAACAPPLSPCTGVDSIPLQA